VLSKQNINKKVTLAKKSNLLVTLADKNYVQQAKQLFSSVYWNAGWDGDYMLLAHEIPEEELKWFREKGILIKICEPLEDKKEKYVYAPVVLDKFYLFTEEFKQWKNIVFLDSDIIVQSSLDGLTKIENFGAVRDIDFKLLDTYFFNPEKIQSKNINYKLNVPAFNSGVFSFNTDIITPDMFRELNRLFSENHKEFKYLDQATLNLYFNNNWQKLPLLYNIFVVCFNFRLPAKIQGIILHFITTPDHHPALWSPENPYYHEWKANLEKAELIDLTKIPKVKKMKVLQMQYYSVLLKILSHEHIRHKIHIFQINYYKFSTSLKHLFGLPKRMIGFYGSIIKDKNPVLYNRLLKIKNKT